MKQQRHSQAPSSPAFASKSSLGASSSSSSDFPMILPVSNFSMASALAGDGSRVGTPSGWAGVLLLFLLALPSGPSAELRLLACEERLEEAAVPLPLLMPRTALEAVRAELDEVARGCLDAAALMSEPLRSHSDESRVGLHFSRPRVRILMWT